MSSFASDFSYNNYLLGQSAYAPTPTLQVTEDSSISRINICSSTEWFSYETYRNIVLNIKSGNIIVDSDLCDTPKDILKPLKLHQKRMLAEMIKKENSEWRLSCGINMCVLGDKVGSGKSINILSLIANNPVFDTNNIILNRMKYSSRDFSGFHLNPTVNFKTNMIVIPHGIYYQWKEYIEKDTKLSHYGIAYKRDIANLNFDKLISGEYNILLVKSTRYNEFMQHIYSIYPYDTSYNDHYKNLVGLEDIFDNKYIFRDLIRIFLHKDFNKIQKSKIIDKIKKFRDILNDVDFDLVKQSIQDFGDYDLKYIKTYTGPLFERVIFDEANSINISNCQVAYGKFNWFVTSSIKDLLDNNIGRRGFIKDTFITNIKRTRCNFIQEIFLKNTDEFIENSFNLPNPILNKIKCYTPPELKILKNVALPEVIHALNAGDLNTAIAISGCTVSSKDNIVTLVLDKLTKQHLNKINKLKNRENRLCECLENREKYKLRKSQLKELLEDDGSEDSVLKDEYNNLIDDLIPKNNSYISSCKDSIKNYSSQIIEIKNKIDSLKSRITNISEKICSVCTDTVSLPPALTPCCRNLFCLECISTSLSYKSICPLCRTPLKLDMMTIIEDDYVINDETDTEITLPRKEDMLIELINSKPDGRFLIFSEYDNSFELVKGLLDDAEISWSKLCGSPGQITNIIKKYTNNEIKVLLLNAKHYGSGLNLQMTSDIILYHRMNADLEEQVIGRGQRLGRTAPLNVNYLCYDNEM